jgi:hypothetical protein
MMSVSRDEVRSVLVRLSGGQMSASEANDWAWTQIQRIEADDDNRDRLVWDTLQLVFGSDLEVGPGEPLHNADDFQAWLDEFDKAADETRGTR